MRHRIIAAFVAFAPALRLPRFLLVAAVTAAVSRAMAGRVSPRAAMAVLAVAWISFYACYFTLMPR